MGTHVASGATTIASGGGLADRYAAALYAHADDVHQLDTVVAEMETLGRTIDASADFRRLLESPLIDVNQSTKIFTTLAEFGTQTKPAQGGTAGPLHNTIAEPDRTQDNSTYWVDDFNQAHYNELFNGKGESYRNFYKDQSLGRFDVTTEVDDWVQVPYNEARYGHNPVDGDGTVRPRVTGRS